MNMPGFAAGRSLYPSRGRYCSGRRVASSRSAAIVPAIPACANCEAILDRCEVNGWKPRAVCAACATGNCYSGSDNPGGRCVYDALSGRVVCDL
jgi:hypothetical protein